MLEFIIGLAFTASVKRQIAVRTACILSIEDELSIYKSCEEIIFDFEFIERWG